jgi:ATP-dependent protease HslVU (ClpYQ) peptidase subunit
VTCIVGVLDGDRIWIGGDSAALSGWFSVARKDEKVFKNGPFTMGFTTSFRMGQLLRYALVPPTRRAGESIEKFMVTTFIDAVRACLKAGGYAEKEKERETGGEFLVAYGGRLFAIDNDYQVEEVVHGFVAIGCAREVAMGALHATGGRPGRERLLVALSAAAEFSAAVRPPFVTMESEPER